jgi:hypothetical protein
MRMPSNPQAPRDYAVSLDIQSEGCPLVVSATISVSIAVAALAQEPKQPYDYSAVVQQICRQYAAAQHGLPYDTMLRSMHVCEGLPSAGFLAVARFPWLSGGVAGPRGPQWGA